MDVRFCGRVLAAVCWLISAYLEKEKKNKQTKELDWETETCSRLWRIPSNPVFDSLALGENWRERRFTNWKKQTFVNDTGVKDSDRQYWWWWWRWRVNTKNPTTINRSWTGEIKLINNNVKKTRGVEGTLDSEVADESTQRRWRSWWLDGLWKSSGDTDTDEWMWTGISRVLVLDSCSIYKSLNKAFLSVFFGILGILVWLTSSRLQVNFWFKLFRPFLPSDPQCLFKKK